MGNAHGAGCKTSSDDSEDEIPPGIDVNVFLRRVNLSTDAMVRGGAGASRDDTFMEQLRNVEPHLDVYEKVALVYLLYDDAHVALQEMRLLVNNGRRTVVQDWYRASRANDENAKEKLLEALAVVQNYKVLKLLGHSKSDIQVRFTPTQPLTSLYVDRTKKYLYRMIESFDASQIERFTRLLRDDVADRGVQHRDFEHLEMQLAYLDTERYISHAGRQLSNLARHLKVMELDEYHDELTERVTSTDRDSSRDVEYGATIDRGCSSDDVYRIDADYPGLCLIIENVDFYRDPEHQDKLINPYEVAERRDGSTCDSKRLKELFSSLRFRVLHKTNLTHQKMLEVIHEAVHDLLGERDGSFFLCILTHGIEGTVIAHNMVPVKVNDIKEVIAGSPNLVGKPKVLVLQSCQGKEVQRIQTDSVKDTLRTDSTGVEVVPSTADFLEIWSTIPGYASYRDIKEGTWFIQTFCSVLEEYPTDHLADQFTKVESIITRKTWVVEVPGGKRETRVMTSVMHSTLTKKLYLPRRK